MIVTEINDCGRVEVGNELMAVEDSIGFGVTKDKLYTVVNATNYYVNIVNDRKVETFLTDSDLRKFRLVVSKSSETEDVEPNKTEDDVNHPSHYTWLKEVCGVEVLDITRHMNFNLGNVVKYILRAGRKPVKTENKSDYYEGMLKDLKKAEFYIKDEIKRVENYGRKIENGL